MIFFSSSLMGTGSLLLLRTQASWDGAGHTRPVNSGKLLVECRRSMASCQRPRYTRSFQSGMMLPSGQPLWQNGTPQSMQRAPCARSLSSGILRSYSRQSCRRSLTERRSGVSRSISMNPVILPIASPVPCSGRSSAAAAVSAASVHALRLLTRPPGLYRGETRHVVARSEMLALEHRAVFGRHHPDEFRRVAVPVGQDPLGEEASGVLMV